MGAGDWTGRGAAAGIVLLAVAVFATSFRGAFVFDDHAAIVENESLRSLGAAIADTSGSATTIGRPLLNLSFAFDRAWGGGAAWAFHATNLAIHAAAGVVLFALARRTLASDRVPSRLRAANVTLAFVIAALWTVHPLQTESVTYVCQRAESLAGLLTLSALHASVLGRRSRVWSVASPVLCLFAVAVKETAVVVPLLALLHDRTFGEGSFAAALRRRPAHHAGLAASWLLLGALVVASDGRRGSAGFDAGVGVAEYAATQPRAILAYLRLSVWPDDLVLDRGAALARGAAAIAPAAAALAGLVGWTAWALRRRPALGFLGAWFFVCLAPSSSVVPLVTQTSAEHRMYLALAAVVAASVLGAHALLGGIRDPGPRGLAGAAAVSLALGALAARTHARNADYAAPRTLWGQSAAFDPSNPRPHVNLALLAARAGDLAAGLSHLDAARAADPANAYVRLVRGNLLHALGRSEEAVAEYTAAAASPARAARALTNRAAVRLAQGRADLALSDVEDVLARDPGYPPALRVRAAALGARAGE